jgi:hypothetical protein
MRDDDDELLLKKKQPKSPFKDREELRKEITEFINIFKTTVVDHAERMSDYFEMSCFNYIVKYYQLIGYTVKVSNLQTNQYRYKCSPAGIQSNFSYFTTEITVDGKKFNYQIHHNLAVESAHTKGIFTTPDITIIKYDGVEYTKDLYESKRRFSYTNQLNLITFCEVKQFNPFPELLFNFIGTINELIPSVMNNSTPDLNPPHIAPSLMISGIANKHAVEIKKSIEGRYCVNIIYEMFYTATTTFSKRKIKDLRTVGHIKPIVSLPLDLMDEWLRLSISAESQ